MLIWIRALLSTAAEIITLEGREMLVSLISSPVTDWLLHNTSSLARLDRITIVSQGYVLLGSAQIWSAWFEFTIACFLAPSLGILSLNYTTLVFVSLKSCICQLFRKYDWWLRRASSNSYGELKSLWKLTNIIHVTDKTSKYTLISGWVGEEDILFASVRINLSLYMLPVNSSNFLVEHEN